MTGDYSDAANIPSTPEQADLLHRIVDQVRRSLELSEVLNTTAQEVRAFLQVDRVMIYRFAPDESGEVVAEAIDGDRLPSLIGLRFPADDIPPSARELFVKARQRTVIDVLAEQIGVSPLNHPKTGESETGGIRYRPIDPCHRDYLTAMGVRASLVVPLLNQEKLWGLLVAHHSQACSISETNLQLVQRVADQVCVAIAQAELLAKAQEQSACETQINRIAAWLHAQPQFDAQMTLEEVTTLLGSTGGRLFLAPQPDQPAQVYTCGETLPAFQPETVVPLEQHFVWREFFKLQTEVAPPPPVWALTDLHREAPMLLRAIAFRNTPIRGLLVMPLQYRQQFYGYLTLFRNEIETEILWAGRFNPDQRQTEPRRSFEVWQQLQQGQAQPWTEAELQVARAVAYHCSLSIHHHQLHEQVHRLNANLEQQVQERTTQLEQALSQAIVQAQQLAQLTERQQVLARVISTIRASLDLDTLFNATAREVRQLLNADRVGIFRFYSESHFDDGEFVSEDVLPEFPSALAAKIHDHCFGDRYAVAYQQGRIQVIDNLDTAGLSPCHLEVLSRFEIKANLVVPLLQGEDLWGLLCIHQCAHPRHWQADEIEFIQQIASQLGVALQQAELFSQTRHQANQLAQALHNLQQTQTSLIQTEKMSSLGQLVAGVAHEINNPVNFIYGNLSHATEYTYDLLELLRLYQEQYPNPATVVADKARDIDLEFLTEDLPKMLSSMKVGADRIRQIVLSLRNFSRLDQAEMKPVDIHEGIDSTLMILQHRLKVRTDSPQIQVVKHYGHLPPVECYAGQLNQVFMNVLGNAIDALDSAIKQDPLSNSNPPTISIRTEIREGDRVVIRIADNGPGISEDVRSRIFDPFFTTKAVGHGTGLGLSISYQIVVEKHGGTLQCLSEPNQGTEFWIEIPRAQSSSKTPKPESVQAR